MADTYDEFTTEQLLALAAGLGLPDPLFLRSSPMADWSPEVRAEVEVLGVRSLLARDLVRIKAGEMRVPLVLRHVLEAICEATVATTVCQIGAGGNVIARMYSRRDHTTVSQPAFGGNHRIRSFPTPLIGDAIVLLTGLRKIAAPSGEPATITAEAATKTLDALVAALGSEDPVDDSSFDLDLGAFASATAECTINNVTITRQQSASTVDGVVVSWLDDPVAGLFLIEGAESLATISPASGDSILSEIMSGYTDGQVPDLRDVAWDVSPEAESKPQ